MKSLWPFLLLLACNDSTAVSPDASSSADARMADSGTSSDARPADAGADAGCQPTAPATEVCDQVDNDCNGLVDDVDEAGDGIYDCQRIGLLGGPGANGSSNFVAWLTSNGSDVVRLHDSGAHGELTAELLADYDVLVLDRLVSAYSPGEAAVLADWVEAGGGLMVLSGYSGGSADVDYPNSLLVDIGLALGGSLVSGVTVFAPHPVSTGVTAVTFSGGFHVSVVEGVGGGTSSVVATINGEPVGIVQQRGLGRVFVWGDEWITFDSEWSSMPEIQVFWGNILAWLGNFRD